MTLGKIFQESIFRLYLNLMYNPTPKVTVLVTLSGSNAGSITLSLPQNRMLFGCATILYSYNVVDSDAVPY